MKKRVRITRCYLVELVDNNDKEIISDFCFGTKEDAQKLGDKMIKENNILESLEVEKMNERKYFVANDNGDLAGHDMDLATAEQCLAEMIEKEPNAGWELMEEDNEE